MKHGGFFGPSRGQISAIHDSREMIESKMGVIHVIKDESQILPYCILHLTRDQLDSGAVSPRMAMQGPMQRMAGVSVPGLKPNMPQQGQGQMQTMQSQPPSIPMPSGPPNQDQQHPRSIFRPHSPANSYNNQAASFASTSQGAVNNTPATVTSAEEYEKRVMQMEKYLRPLQKEIKDNPSHTKLNRLLEIISKPKKRLVPLATLDKCEETLKKKFGW